MNAIASKDAMVEDITEQKRAAEALREAQAELRSRYSAWMRRRAR